ncbi:MAG: sn-glycerol-3-phosphate ABC transporter ATP-binding protein UgpC [Acholeplasmatales bacterium]|nr:sn-glycerol-3-phosphate ABC transporter ATP-binding protein UgpC [Acholeplasmatales bacterium]
MAELNLNHIYKVYPNGVKAVNDFNMHIDDKEFIVLVGPSGCGKSTTLRMIAGLEDISAGELKIGDEVVNDVEPKDRDVAMVFQNYALYPHMTVYENMAFGLKIRHVSKEEIHERIVEAAKILDIEEYLDRKPKAMSGGQRQRVALGRAILRNPKVFLLDEPLSNLDAKLRTQMRAEISSLHQRLQTTFIYVTHDQVEAMTMGTRIVVMKGGYVQQIDKPKNLYNYPCNKFVAGFIGTPQMNFFECYLSKKDDFINIKFEYTEQEVKVPALYFVKLNPNYLDGKKKVYLGLRSEHISINKKDLEESKTNLKIRLSHKEELGSETLIYGDINMQGEGYKETSTRVIIKTNQDVEFNNGDVIDAAFNFAQCHIFDYETEDSVLPRVPQINYIPAEIKDNHILFLGENIKLPQAINAKDSKGTLIVPIDAVKPGKLIDAKISVVEKVNDKYLLYLHIEDLVLFMLSDTEYKVGSVIKIDIDFKKIEFKSLNETIIEPFKVNNSIPLKFIKQKVLKEVETEKGLKKQKVIDFYLDILGEKILSPEKISRPILSALGTKAFNLDYMATIDAYSFIEDPNGFKAKVEKEIIYDDERFVTVDVLGEKINVRTDNKSNELSLKIDLDKIGITETSIDIKLV